MSTRITKPSWWQTGRQQQLRLPWMLSDSIFPLHPRSFRLSESIHALASQSTPPAGTSGRANSPVTGEILRFAAPPFEASHIPVPGLRQMAILVIFPFFFLFYWLTTCRCVTCESHGRYLKTTSNYFTSTHENVPPQISLLKKITYKNLSLLKSRATETTRYIKD